MNPIWTPLVGRFGNKCFQFAHAQKQAEQRGVEVHCPEWEGEEFFEMPEHNREQEGCDLDPGYHQNQESMIYTVADARRWFTFKPQVLEKLKGIEIPPVAAHYRCGDLLGYGYPVVGKKSFHMAYLKYSASPYPITFVEEENPTHVRDLPDYIVDFYRLMKAPELFRANSSFSWWAATLSDGKVFAPIIDGLAGGVIYDKVPFVPGNYPKLSNIDGCTDMKIE